MNNHHERIEKLRKMAQLGEITYSDVQKKLTAAIEKEYQSEQPNIDFINACEGMLWEIGTQGHQQFISANDRYLEVIRQSVKPQTERKIPLFPIRRIAMSLSVFVLIVCLCGGSLHWHWYFSGVSPDNEQYTVRGRSIDITLVSRCIAEHEHDTMIKTDSWDQLVSFLGFEPEIINPSAIKSTDVHYYAYIESEAIHIDTRYAGDGISFLFSLWYYTDVDEAYFAIEQDANGEKYSIGSFTIYINNNQDHCSFTWLDDFIVYHVSGQFSQDDGLGIIQKYLKEKNHE